MGPPEPRSNLRFILVRPRNPLNIGAAARAMANFGFSDLAVVKPHPPVWRETVSAVGAEQLVRSAKRYGSIDDALADRILVIGTTALRTRRRERPVVPLPALRDYLAKRHPDALAGGPVALLFGPEKTGLSGGYLERCHFWLTVPTAPETPSLNLSHAVALCAYAWAGTQEARGPAVHEIPAATVAQRARLARQTLAVFHAARYLPFLSDEEKTRKLRRLFLSWNLRRQDVALLLGALRFILRGLKTP